MNTPCPVLLLLLFLTSCGSPPTITDAEAEATIGFELVGTDPEAATGHFLNAAVTYRSVDSLWRYHDFLYDASDSLEPDSVNMEHIIRLLTDVYTIPDQIHPAVARTYGLLGYYYAQAGNELQAMGALQKAYESYPPKEFERNIMPVIYYAGSLIRIGDNEQAIGLLSRHEADLLNTGYPAEYRQDLLDFYAEFAVAYWDQGSNYTQKGLNTVQRGLEQALHYQLDTFPDNYARLLLKQANLHLLNEDATSAAATLSQINGFKPAGEWSTDSRSNHQIYLSKLTSLAQIKLLRKDYSSALQIIREAIEGQRACSRLQDIKRLLAKQQLDEAAILKASGDHNAAISACIDALQSVLPNYRSEESDLPSPTLFYAENTITEALHLLGQSAAAQYQMESSPESLDLAIGAYRDAEIAELILLDRLTFTSAQLSNLETRQERHAEYLALLLQSQQKGTDRMEEVYRIMAENHAYVLRRELAYQQTLSQQQRKDNAAILRRFQGFTDSIGILNLELQQPNLSRPDYQQILAYKTDLYERRAETKKVLDDLFDSPIQATSSTFGSLAAYQSSLDQNTLAVHFFPGENGNYYRLSVSRDQTEFNRFRLPIQLLNDFTELLTNPDRARLDQDVASNLSFMNNSAQIYQHLFGQSQLAPVDYHQLRIYPAGELNQLPFEALYPTEVTESSVINEQSGARYLRKELAFLGKNVAISYHHAVIDAETENTSSLDFLTLLPEYDCPAWNISASSKEMKQYMQKYSSQVITGSQLTKNTFKSDFSKGKATLFYGHFFANPENPLNGYFALACPNDSTVNQDRWRVRDLLSGEPLDQELFIVAGCGSGRGKEIPGEGIDNLERLLLSKGVKHVVTAHWDIDQATTVLLLENFIEAISSGEAMSSALQQAHSKLIDNHPVYSHPYYWAGLRLASKI